MTVHATAPAAGAARGERDVAVLVTFFAATYALTWAAFGATFALLPDRAGLAVLRGATFYLGVFAPALVALALTYRAHGRAGMRDLLRPILHFDVRLRWYVFAVAYLPAIKLTAALLQRAGTGAWPTFGTAFWVMPFALLVSTWVQAGEEVGWRGYALPRLAARLGAAPASLLLGVIWALWHLPLFFVPEASTFRQSLPLYVLQVTAVSAAMTWLYWKTGGSLLLVMLMHAAVNNTKDIVPSVSGPGAGLLTLHSSSIAWLTVTLLWLGAAFFLRDLRHATLRTPAADDGRAAASA